MGKNVMRPGFRIGKKYGYIFLESIPSVYTVIEKFDKFEEGKIYVFGYDYHMKDFYISIQKQTPDRIRVSYLHHEIWIYKERNKYKVFIPWVREKYRNELDYLFNSNFYFHYNRIIYKWTGIKEFKIILSRAKSFTMEIRIAKRMMYNDIITGELKDMYTPRDMVKKGIVVWEDIRGNKFVLTRINNTEMKKVKKRIEKKEKSPDIYYKQMMKTKDIMYQFIKMFRNKGILKTKFEIKPVYIPPKLRTQNKEIMENMYRFSFPYELENRTVRFNGVMTILIDYDYDSVNQILFKFLQKIGTWRHNTLLCGIDPQNRFWCNILSNFMRSWKIKSVYKNMYELDENTKMYEF
jgi:hypothetical protein